MFVGLISDVGGKDAHKEAALWALGRALREKGVLSVILREPAYSGNVSEFLAGQMAVLSHEREVLRRYGVFDQLSGFAGVEEASCRSFEDSVWAGGKKVPVYDRALFLLPQLRYHGISQKPETEEKYIFVDVSAMTDEIARAIGELAKQRGISSVVLVRYGEGDNRMLFEGTGLTLLDGISGEDTKGYVGALWMSAGVVTDRYVGVSLALIHEKPFLAVKTSIAEDGQIRALLEFFNLVEHIYNSGEKIGDCFEIPDQDSLHKGLRALRDKEGGRVAGELLFEDANMLVKCPVKIPLSQCSACGACEAVCAENAIHMEADEYGFLHPVVTESLCTDCGSCSEVCIKRGQRQLVQFPDESYPRFYLAQSKERSGAAYSGIFGQMVRYLIKERDAIVFGGILDEELRPVVIYTQDADMAERFAEKRYLVNDTRHAFRKVKEFLDADRFVVYTGSACECAGLRGYLKRHYPKLFLCELLCHETISNKAFGMYVDMLSRRKDSKLKNIRFGDFSAGTKAESAVLYTEYENGENGRVKFSKSRYMQMIEQQLAVNEACANCSYLGKKRVGDITLADFQKNTADLPRAWADACVAVVSTAKGGRVLRQLEEAQVTPVEFDSLLRHLYKKTAAMPNERPAMLKLLQAGDLAGIFKNVTKK